MTATTDAPTLSGFPDDHRGRPWPTAAMVRTRIMELRHRRGLMIALLVVNIGLPTLFFTIRLVSHLVSPKVYGPAGGYDLYTTMIAGVLPTFGFIVAASFSCVIDLFLINKFSTSFVFWAKLLIDNVIKINPKIYLFIENTIIIQ